MAYQTSFLRVYLYLALAFGLLGITDNSLTWFNVALPFYIYPIIFILSLLFFTFNCITIPTFLHQRVPKIALVLPIYHVVTFLLFYGSSIIAFMLYLSQSPLSAKVILSIGLIASIFETVFSIYLLRKFGLFSKPVQPSGHMQH